MAAAQAQKSLSTFECSYDIFLSFRGVDTRKNFTDRLYVALENAGFFTFRDNDEIGRGRNIKSELHKAIKNSRMSLIVFSKGYASSKSCFFEVETILEHSKMSKHFILPVFYDVDPSDIRKQAKELIAPAEIGRLETDEAQNEWVDKVKKWSAAFKEVATMAGMVLQNEDDGHEAKFIQKIVEWVKARLIYKVRKVVDHLVGMDSRATDINCWLEDRSSDVGMFVISGMGGIGKTTLAKVTYNANFARFDGSSFLANITNVSKETNGLVRLQRQLLSDILNKREGKIHDVDDGLRRIQYVLFKKRVLLVLDDVDEVDQLDAILGMRDWFCGGSKIIITTRRECLLKAHENFKIHKIETLSDIESLELFSWHAFEGYREHSKGFVHHCNGLPLALMVLGSSVSGQSLDVWQSTLKKLEVIPHHKIIEKLKISYDSLHDQHDRKLFLDIACFFVGKNNDDTIVILDECGYCTITGIQSLIDRNLLRIEKNKFGMHQLIQDMGRQIVGQESDYPNEQSRLWRHEESFNILREKTGTRKIEGLVLDKNRLKKNKTVSTNFDQHPWKFFWNPVDPAVRNSGEIVLETKAFERMHNLRLLKLSYVQFSGTYEVLPKRLRLLYWRGFHLRSIPNNFSLENLVALDMRNSSLEQVWRGNHKVFASLKILNLRHSPHLAKTPHFSRIPNLEKLILKDCPSLTTVDESVAKLERLFFLNLKNCKNLRKLPLNIGMVKSLEQLIISGCSNLVGVKDELEKMESLKVLQANGMPIHQLVSATREVGPWHAVMSLLVPKPTISPKTLWASFPSSLVSLSLENCNLSDDTFSKQLGKLSMLQHLYLGGNPICSIPDCIKDLTRLKTLNFINCPKIQQIRWPSIVIDELDVSYCTSLTEITQDSGVLPKKIVHAVCENLCYVQGAFETKPASEFDLEVINDIGFFNLDSMADVEVVVANGIVWSKRKCPIKVLYEYGVWNTFFPGRDVPQWFCNKTIGSTITFTVPSSPHLTIRALNLCLVYTLYDRESFVVSKLCAEFHYKTRNWSFKYKPRFYGVPEADGYIVWLSHWRQDNIGLERGDEVQVSFEMNADGEIKECGVHLLYYDEKETPSSSSDSKIFGHYMLEGFGEEAEEENEGQEEEEKEEEE